MSGLEGLLSGRLLGERYRVEEVIGRGGMGAVYRAVDERLGRQVALKVITASTGNDAESRARLRARFHREARAAAALPHHPNVVPVYDYGSDAATGLDYLVMELLRGQDLATRLAHVGPPPLSAALKILYEAARGLAVGHRAGLIHRDVKPGNIFLAESDHHEVQVRMVDFGIAKLAADEDTFSDLTQDGRVPHSPAFASPEQLRGLSSLTPASDVFSLGAVGYTLLTGQRPFSEEQRNQMSLGMPASAPSPRDTNPAIPGAVEEVIRRALSFDPTDRFPDAAAMAAALGTALRALPDTPLEPYADLPPAPTPEVVAHEDDRTRLMPDDADDRTLLAPAPPPRRPTGPPPAPADRRPPPRRYEEPRRGIGGILVWSLVLLVLAGAGLWAWSEMSGERTAAVEIPPPPDSLGVVVDPNISVEPVEEPTELDAAINNQEGLRFYQERRFDSALVQFQRAVGISPENAQYRRNLGLTLLQLGDADGATSEFQQALRLDPGLEIAYANLGEAQLARGDTFAATAALQNFLERSTNPALRGRVERRMRDILAAQSGRGAAAGAPGDTAGGAVLMDTVAVDTARTPGV